jgi:hypothetical protein
MKPTKTWAFESDSGELIVNVDPKDFNGEAIEVLITQPVVLSAEQILALRALRNQGDWPIAWGAITKLMDAMGLTEEVDK